MKRIINVNGFEPSSEESQFMQIKLDQIMAEAPARASIDVKLEKKAEIFEGVAHIFFGPTEPLMAKASGSTLEEMVNALSQGMQNQIEQWRQDRFANGNVESAV